MKKPHPPPPINIKIVILLANSAVNAQQFAAVNNRDRGFAPPAEGPRERSRIASEEAQAQINALLRRVSALEKYLRSIDPNSAEYKAVEHSTRDLADRIQVLSQSLNGQQTVAGALARQASTTHAASDPTFPAKAVNSTEKISISTGAQFSPYKREIKIKVDRSISGYTVIVRDRQGREVYSQTYRNLMRNVDDYTAVVSLTDGENVVTVSSVDGTDVSAPLVLTTGAAAARPNAPVPRQSSFDPMVGSRKSNNLVGLVLGGVVVSQQADNFSQADPFFGFIAGYTGHLGECPKEGDKPPAGTRDTRPCKQFRDENGQTQEYASKRMLHLRFTGIFQVQPKKEEAPEDTGDNGAPSPVDPTDFTPFLASRKSFDIEGSLWMDSPFLDSPHVYIGPYIAVGGSTYVDKNELLGDETVQVEGSDAPSAGDGQKMQLDTTRARIDNDINYYAHAGAMINVFSSPGVRKNLFMQTVLAYGRYEGLAGLNPGKTGFLNDSRNRFIGKLRIFPSFLDTNPVGSADMSPMFGVEINAGRGPDQLKFFTGVGVAFKLFKAFKKQAEEAAGGENTPGTD